eukprot:6190521-Amphidinium_carterae.3
MGWTWAMVFAQGAMESFVRAGVDYDGSGHCGLVREGAPVPVPQPGCPVPAVCVCVDIGQRGCGGVQQGGRMESRRGWMSLALHTTRKKRRPRDYETHLSGCGGFMVRCSVGESH